MAARKRPSNEKCNEPPEKLTSEDENYRVYRNIYVNNRIVEFIIKIIDVSHDTMGVKLYCSHDQAPFIVITLKNNKATLNECRVYYDSDWRIDGMKEFINQKKALTVILSKMVAQFEPIVSIESTASSYIPIPALADALRDHARTPISRLSWIGDFDDEFPRLLHEAGNKELYIELGMRPVDVDHLLTEQYINETINAIHGTEIQKVSFLNYLGNFDINNPFPDYCNVVLAPRTAKVSLCVPMSVPKLKKIIEKWLENPVNVPQTSFTALLSDEDQAALCEALHSHEKFVKFEDKRLTNPEEYKAIGNIESPDGEMTLSINVVEVTSNSFTAVGISTVRN